MEPRCEHSWGTLNTTSGIPAVNGDVDLLCGEDAVIQIETEHGAMYLCKDHLQDSAGRKI